MEKSVGGRFLVGAILWAVFATGCGGGGSGGSTGTPGSQSTPSSAHGTADCATGNASFSVTPLALSNVVGWVPLGAMEPSGHTFPTDHQYLYFATPGSASVSVPVVAPSDMRIWMIYQTMGIEPEFSIWMQPCAQIIGRLGSITALSSDLAAAAGSINQNCQTSPGTTNSQCQAELQYDVKAGQVIGTISSTTAYALDWWLWDSRVAPIHFTDPGKFTGGPEPNFTEANIVPASAYYTAALTAQVAAKLGSFDGTQQRTTAPVGGTIQVDVDGTARGYWFNSAQAYPPETYQAALAPDNVQPTTTQVISLGLSQPNPGVFRASFAPVTTGQVNRAFEAVTADGNVYCYQGVAENTGGQTRVALLQLLDANTLKIEVLASSISSCAGAQPWTFSSSAVTYKR